MRKRVIAYKPAFAHLWGVEAGVLLSQALYWSERTRDPEGWFPKTAQDWLLETGLTRRQFEKARRILAEAGVLVYEIVGIPPCTRYRVNRVRLQECENELYALEKRAGFLEVPETPQEAARALHEEARLALLKVGCPAGIAEQVLREFAPMAILRTLRNPAIGDPRVREFLAPYLP